MRKNHRSLFAVLWVSLFAAACSNVALPEQVHKVADTAASVKPTTGPESEYTGASPVGSAAPSLQPASNVSATPVTPGTPLASNMVLNASRSSLLMAALQDSVAASRAAKLTNTIGDITSVLANNTSRLISDNGSQLISNNSSSLIGNNSGGLVSNNSAGYHLQDVAVSDAECVGATAAAATASIADKGGTAAIFAGLANGFSPDQFSAPSGVITYDVNAQTPTTGYFKSYQSAAYVTGAATQAASALIDYFTWDNVTVTLPYQGDKSQYAQAFHMVKQSSTRVSFASDMTATQIFQISLPNVCSLQEVQVGFLLDFALDVSFLSGSKDHSTFHAVATQADLVTSHETDNGTLSVPKHLALTGTNSTGSYTGSLDGQSGVSVNIVHTATADGAKSTVALTTNVDGTGTQTISIPAANLSVVLNLDGKGSATGVLNDTTSGTASKIGDVTCDTTGVATFTLTDGSTVKAQIF